MKPGDVVRVNRPGMTLFMQVVEYHGRVVTVDGDTCEVLDDARARPGEPGAIRREKISDCHRGYWEKIWHDAEPESEEAPAEGDT